MNVQRNLKFVNRRIQNTIARGVVQLSDASKMLQTLQLTVLKDEVLADVQHFEPNGFTCRPKEGAEAILLCRGGNRSSAICIMVSDRRFRITDLGQGEVAMYDDANNMIHFKQDKTIAVQSDGSVAFTTPTVTMSGDLIVAGDVSDATGTMQAMRDAYNAHTHPYTDDGAAKTTSITTGQM